MKKKTLKVRIVTCCLAGALLTAVPVYNIEAAASTVAAESKADIAAPVAGVSLAMTGYLEDNSTGQASSAADAKKNAKENTKSGTKENVKDTKEAKKTENADTAKNTKEAKEKKTSKYDDMAVAQVDDYVNIRKKPDEDAELLGKLYSNSVAKVIKEKDGWCKIESGTVTGYVKADYITVGDEDLVKSAGVEVATVNTTTLKVRSRASKKSDVVTLVPDGEELTVSSMKQYKDGWVKVQVDGGKGYVSADYVDISRQYSYAESRAEEEARLAIERERQEAEEAARRAEEENAQSADSAASSTGTADSSTGTGSSSTGSSSQSSSSGTGSSTGSSSGQAVVNFASQFVGNPYVWGGTSLTNGADCSGFVMSVYANFGVSLPHSSDALCGSGYGVSYDSMQPGDIICYDGHVAIYAGNNTVVHASNPASGIKYTSPANYRSVVAVRRIF